MKYTIWTFYPKICIQIFLNDKNKVKNFEYLALRGFIIIAYLIPRITLTPLDLDLLEADICTYFQIDLSVCSPRNLSVFTKRRPGGIVRSTGFNINLFFTRIVDASLPLRYDKSSRNSFCFATRDVKETYSIDHTVTFALHAFFVFRGFRGTGTGGCVAKSRFFLLFRNIISAWQWRGNNKSTMDSLWITSS